LASLSPTAFTLSQLTGFLKFGTSYTNRCSMNLATVLTSTSTLLYDLYYVDENDELMPVPVQNQNRRDASGNTAGSQLTGRFFLIDIASGIETAGALPTVVQYAQSIELRIRQIANDVKIYPPTLIITYAQRTLIDIQAGSTGAAVSFSAVYTADQSGVFTAMTVMFALAVCCGSPCGSSTSAMSSRYHCGPGLLLATS
jgi:hypothetical protein